MKEFMIWICVIDKHKIDWRVFNKVCILAIFFFLQSETPEVDNEMKIYNTHVWNTFTSSG